MNSLLAFWVGGAGSVPKVIQAGFTTPLPFFRGGGDGSVPPVLSDEPVRLADPTIARKRQREPFDLGYYQWRYGNQSANQNRIDELTLEDAEKISEEFIQQSQTVQIDLQVIEQEIADYREAPIDKKITSNFIQDQIELMEALRLQVIEARKALNNELAMIVSIVEYFY